MANGFPAAVVAEDFQGRPSWAKQWRSRKGPSKACVIWRLVPPDSTASSSDTEQVKKMKWCSELEKPHPTALAKKLNTVQLGFPAFRLLWRAKAGASLEMIPSRSKGSISSGALPVTARGRRTYIKIRLCVEIHTYKDTKIQRYKHTYILHTPRALYFEGQPSNQADRHTYIHCICIAFHSVALHHMKYSTYNT